jgi:competence protein ComFC
MGRLKLFAQQMTQTVADFFFPPKCVGCGCAGSFFCVDCQAEIEPAVQTGGSVGFLVEHRAAAAFAGKMQQAIHKFKYENVRQLASPLAQYLVSEVQRAGWSPTLVTAVPLHDSRFRERGYNQSALLGQVLAECIGVSFNGEAIHRIRQTQQQVGLNMHERQENVAGAFSAGQRLVHGQRVIIVDDVFTTGATLRECAQALHEAGAECVWGLTVASAAHGHN